MDARPPKQRTIHFPDGSTAKVYLDEVVERPKPTFWQSIERAIFSVFGRILP